MATTFSSLKVTGTAIIAGVLGLTAGISGTLIFSDQAPEITGTGADGATQVVYEKYDRTDLTATGSLAKYTMYSFANPLTVTGAIQEFCIEVAVATTSGVTPIVDCGVVHDGSTATGKTLFNDEALSAGIHCSQTGALLETVFGPTEQIRCAAITGTGAGLNAEGFVKFRETIVP